MNTLYLLIIILSIIVLILLVIRYGYGYEERTDMPVYHKTLTFCYLTHDESNSLKELECNYVGGFTQEQLQTMRDHLEEYAEK
jgi:hypothetical protein